MISLHALKHRTSVGIGLFVVLLVSAVYLITGGDESEGESARPVLKQVKLVSVSELSQEDHFIEALGTVRSVDQVDIRAQRTGQVISLPVSEGQYVNVGQVIVELDRADLEADVAQAQANLMSARAVYDRMLRGAREEDIQILEQRLIAANEQLKELERGSRPEEVELARARLENAKKNRDDAQTSLANTVLQTDQDITTQVSLGISDLANASITVNGVLNEGLVNIITVEGLGSFLNCTFKLRLFEGTSKVSELCGNSLVAKRSLEDQVKILSAQTSPDAESFLGELSKANDSLRTVRTFLSTLQQMMNGVLGILNNDLSLTDSDIEFLKSEIVNAQSRLEPALSQMVARRESLSSILIAKRTQSDDAQRRLNEAENAVLIQQQELLLREAPATSETIAIQKAQIREIEAQLELSRKGEREEVLRQQQGQIQQAEGALSRALATRDKSVIISPVSGTLVYLQVERGDVISGSEVIATVANERELEIQGYITEKERRLIDLGADISVKDSEAKGVITSISPALDPKTKKLEIKAAISAAGEDLIIGESRIIRITQDHTLKILQVPVTALRLKSNEATVFGVDDELKTMAMPVTIGRVLQDKVEILTGLTATDLIIPDISGIEPGEMVEILPSTDQLYDLNQSLDPPLVPTEMPRLDFERSSFETT